MLELHEISINFKDFRLKPFTYSFSSNCLYELCGKNGSGKSTILKIIKGIYKQKSGHLSLNNRQLKSDEVVYIDSNARSFFHRLTLYQNLEYFNALNKFNSSNNEIINLLHLFKADKLMNKVFADLSQGQMQLSCLIRGFISKSKVLLIDEAFSSLDMDHKTMVLSYIEKLILNNDTHVIFVSHESMNFKNTSVHKIELDYEE